MPETLKNMLLVMSTAGVLAPSNATFWDVRARPGNLFSARSRLPAPHATPVRRAAAWQVTWKRCGAICVDLTPALLQLARPAQAKRSTSTEAEGAAAADADKAPGGGSGGSE